jgi:2-oxoglutarate/2-oxoacid ferredoxin oxidoreductase subunit alpha
MSKKVLMKGNIAICEGAIKAGCQAYFGYPITPQNEIPAWMSKRMVELGRVFIQSESELSAINMVFGAALTGARAMTSSSSPGISLKQEGISYMAGCELPCVIVNVQRGGPGLGNISGSQGDYFQSTRGGGHGDYRTLVLAPDSVQEMYDLSQEAFDLADKYRNPVLILMDGILGQMMEPAQIEIDSPQRKLPAKDWVLDGAKGRVPRSIKSLLMTEGDLEKHNHDLEQKYQKMKEEVRYETDNLNEAEIVLVAFGISARVAKSAMQMANNKGKKVGLIRPITLYPFPEKIISQTADKVKKFLVVEMNLGQMVEDVKLSVNGKAEVHFYGRPGGGVISQEEVLEEVTKIIRKQ